MTRGRDKFEKFRPLILALSRFYGVFPRRIRAALFVRARNKTGNVGLVVRYALLKTLAKSVGENVSVQPGVYLLNPQGLTVGDNVSIHPMCYLECWGGIDIGNDVSIAHGASLISVNHGFAAADLPIKEQPLEPLPITVEENVWIGAKASVLGGVTVKTGTVVAAGAVVTRDTKTDSVVAGVPARLLKMRGTEHAGTDRHTDCDL